MIVKVTDGKYIATTVEVVHDISIGSIRETVSISGRWGHCAAFFNGDLIVMG